LGPDSRAAGAGQKSRTLALGLHGHGLPFGPPGPDRRPANGDHPSRLRRHPPGPGSPSASALSGSPPTRFRPSPASAGHRRRRRVDLEPGPGPLPRRPSTVGPLARRRTSLGGSSRSPRTGHTRSLRLGKAAAPTGSQRSNLRPHRQLDRTQTPSPGSPTEETPNPN